MTGIRYKKKLTEEQQLIEDIFRKIKHIFGNGIAPPDLSLKDFQKILDILENRQ